MASKTVVVEGPYPFWEAVSNVLHTASGLARWQRSGVKIVESFRAVDPVAVGIAEEWHRSGYLMDLARRKAPVRAVVEAVSAASGLEPPSAGGTS